MRHFDTDSRKIAPIAVLGASGQLGGWLCRLLGQRARPLDLPDVDITRRDAILNALLELRPASIINCAAYTDVDRAEREPEACFAVNATAVGHLAAAAAQLNCQLIQVSTDYVFGNSSPEGPRPWREDDAPAPRGVYAESKRAGELAAQGCPRHIVVRTCGLYGHPTLIQRARNFVEAILRQAALGEALRVVSDQICSPSYAHDVAEAICWLSQSDFNGLVHVTNSGATSWYDFARAILDASNLSVSLEPIKTAQYNAPAPRPEYSVLDNARFISLRGEALPSVQAALQTYLRWRNDALR